MTITESDISANKKNRRRALLLIVSRIVIMTIFLGITVFIDVRKQLFSLPTLTIHFFYVIVAVIYLFSVVYAVLFKFKINLKYNVYLQITVDMLAVTSLIFMFGNTQIDYSLLYTMIIIYAAIFLGRRGGMLIASVASICYGTMVNLEFYSMMPAFSFIQFDYKIEAADALTNLIVRITSFYVVAFLASFIVEQEKKATVLLEEKESEFNQLDQLFRSIVESVYTGVMTLDLQNVIQTFNSAAEEITGFEREQVEGRYVGDIFPEFMLFLKKESGSEETDRMEMTIENKKKEKVNLGISVSPLKGKSERQIGNILIFQDITKIKEMEKTLEKNRNLALIGEMAAGWAHEVRNPLAAITGSIELLRQGLELEGTNKRLMEIVARGTNQLESFVRNFLLLARSVPAAREPVDLGSVVEEILENLRIAEELLPGVRVERRYSKKALAFANREQVRQVITNLMLNALQAMEEEGVVSVETRQVKLDDGKIYAELKVTDNGCGIREDDLSKIFEPFYTNKGKGIGLGLAIVSHIVEGYQGKIKVDSVWQKGTTCSVWLPAGP